MGDRSRSRSKSKSRERSRSKSGEGKKSGSEEEEAYEVEEIRDKRRGDDGEYLYYVKWVSKSMLTFIDSLQIVITLLPRSTGTVTPTLGSRSSTSMTARRSCMTSRRGAERTLTILLFHLGGRRDRSGGRREGWRRKS